jgi:hypothetical protein
MDVVTQYENPADGVFATVYLFRTAIPDAALWFDRALAAIMLRSEYGLDEASRPTPVPFARPGATAASGLRASIDVTSREPRSTSLAVAPLGRYLLKVRMSSTNLDRAALDARLSRFIEGLRWPAAAPDERAAAAILDCPTPLRLRNARIVRSSGADTLMDALSGVVLEAADDVPAPIYCREPGATLQYGVYRANGAREAYLIALSDSGLALNIGQSLDLSALLGGGGQRNRFAMTLLGRDSTTVLPSFNRLPPPAQAVAVAFGNRGPTISVSTGDRER